MTNPSPFRPARDRRGLGTGLIVAAAVVSVLMVWRFSGRPAAAPAGGHDMGAMTMPGGDSARTVTLGGNDQRLIGVTFAPVSRTALARRVRTVGIVSYDESRLTTITTRVEGFVERLRVDFTGDRVTRGQVLLDLYAPAVVAAQDELLLGHRLAREVATGTPEARQSAADLIAASRRRLEYWDVPPEMIARIEDTGLPERTFPLRSSAAGFAVEKTVVAGQRVMPGDPLYRLADLRTVWVEGEIYERDLGAVRLGDAAEARFTALAGVTRRGKVAYVYPSVDPDTRTSRVRIELANGDLALRPGMYATLEITGPAEATLTIPRSAALVTGQRTLVFLKRPDGRFEPREVTLGTPDDDRYPVLAGLAAGDTVVASGTFLLDAESNLGTVIGGMGGMPGMDMSPAKSPAAHSHR